MAIQTLRAKGFRSIKLLDAWHPGKLNVVVGPNGSGKSNLLFLLDFIASAARGELSERVQENQGMLSLLWDHQPGRLGWRVTIDPVDDGRDRLDDAVSYKMRLTQIVGSSAYEITDDSVANWVSYDRKETQAIYWIFRRDEKQASFYSSTRNGFVVIDPSSINRNESLLAQLTHPENPIPGLVRKAIRNWTILHNIQVVRGAKIRYPSTTQYTTDLKSDGSNLVNVLHTRFTKDTLFKTAVIEGMRAGFGNEFENLEFQPAAAQQIQLAIKWRGSRDPHSAMELSDGTLRFLLILTALANPLPESVVAIDEPEVGLHPGMMSVIAEYAASAAEEAQIVITTHSPEFLDAFSEYEPQVTVCNWVDGASQFQTLEKESLAGWLERYRLGEMFVKGELDLLALPRVDAVEGLEKKVAISESKHTASEEATE